MVVSGNSTTSDAGAAARGRPFRTVNLKLLLFGKCATAPFRAFTFQGDNKSGRLKKCGAMLHPTSPLGQHGIVVKVDRQGW
jgi:hypothetical protein